MLLRMELSLSEKKRTPSDMPAWRLWVAPRPFTLVSTGVYIAALVIVLTDQCVDCRTPWKGAVTVAVLLVLIVLDRLDYFLYGEIPPVRAGLALIGLRTALIVAVASVAGWWYEASLGIFMLALVPYIAALYAGTKAGIITGAATWMLFAAIEVVASIPGLTKVTVYEAGRTDSYYMITDSLVSQYLSSIVLFTIVLTFVLTAARVAALEKAHTARSQHLLAQLEDSHAKLRAYSERAMADTEERNRSARDIHDRLGHYLTAISVQISKAMAFRDLQPTIAGEAITEAKQAISQALQDVRRSVAALRANEAWQDTPIQDEAPQAYDTEESEARRGKKWFRWLRWLCPRPYDVVATTLYIGLFLMSFSELGFDSNTSPLIVGALLLSLALIDRLDFAFFNDHPPAPIGVILLAARIGIMCILFFGQELWVALLLIVLIPFLCFLYFGDKTGYIAGGVLWLALWILQLGVPFSDIQGSQWGTALGQYALSLLLISFIMAVAVATSRTVGKENRGRARAEQLYAELRETHTRLASLSKEAIAAIEERNRMARDIHDGMGHYLTAMSVQLEKARAFREIDATSADKALDESKRLAGEALQEVRNTIGALGEREEAPSLARSLTELVRRMEKGNLNIRLDVAGSEDGYSGQAISALYRAAQEGLTNISKHAQAESVQIRLALGEDEARLDISDDGRGFPVEVEETKGYGLQSMKERLELAGGSLQIESAPGDGVHLIATVPAQASVRRLVAVSSSSSWTS